MIAGIAVVADMTGWLLLAIMIFIVFTLWEGNDATYTSKNRK